MNVQAPYLERVENGQQPAVVEPELQPAPDFDIPANGQVHTPSPEVPLPSPRQASRKSTGRLELSDLAEVDDAGIAYLTTKDGVRHKLSEHGRAQIMAHEEQIRKGLGQLLASRGLVELDVNNRVHRVDGSFMSNKELVKLAEANPVPTKPKGFFARAKAALQRGSTATKVAYTRAGNFLMAPAGPAPTQEELEHRKRIGWLLVGAVGAVAVSRLVMQFHGFEHGGNGAVTIDQTPQPGSTQSGSLPAGTPAPASTSSGSLPPYDVEQGGVLEPKQFDQVRLEKGDTIWDLEEARHPNMSQAQIHELVQRDLNANKLTWDDARRLKIGRVIKLVRFLNK